MIDKRRVCFILRNVHRQYREKLGMQENFALFYGNMTTLTGSAIWVARPIWFIVWILKLPKNLVNNSLKGSLYRRGVESFLDAYLGKWQVYWMFSRVEQLLFRGKKETYIWIHRICMGGCLRSSDVTKSRQEVDLGLRKTQFQTKWEYIKKKCQSLTDFCTSMTYQYSNLYFILHITRYLTLTFWTRF